MEGDFWDASFDHKAFGLLSYINWIAKYPSTPTA
jgi:hypothetical protein